MTGLQWMMDHIGQVNYILERTAVIFEIHSRTKKGFIMDGQGKNDPRQRI